MNNRKAGMVFGVIAGVVLVGALVVGGAVKRAEAEAVAQKKMDVQQAPRPVTVDRVKRLDSVPRRTYPGVVRASEESALSFRVGGPLVQVNVTLGAPVKQGALLMQIDPRDFEDRIQSLEAQLAGAQAMQQNAREEFARAEKLFAEKVVAQADFDRARSALDGADAAVKNLDALLNMARHSLADTALVAPYDGAVTAQLVENHEMVAPGRVVLRFHNTRQLEVVVNIPENEMVGRNMIDAGPVQVDFPAVPGKTFEARLKEWGSVAAAATRTYPVTFEFDAPETFNVLPGMSARISWNAGPSAGPQLTVPLSALAPGEDGLSTLWVYDPAGGSAQRRSVRTDGLCGTSRMIVLSGVGEGEQVVVSGSRLVHEGMELVPASAE